MKNDAYLCSENKSGLDYEPESRKSPGISAIESPADFLDTIIERAQNVINEQEKKKKGAPNPKDLVGAKKVDISLLPQVAVVHAAHAMMDGAKKYNPYNWRDYDVEARSYVSAAIRHLQAWLEGEERAEDSEVHHLGHAIACCAIILDAQSEGKLIDNRPKHFGGYKKTIEEVHSIIKRRAERSVSS